MWSHLAHATAVALAGLLLCAWGSPAAGPTPPPQAGPGARVLLGGDERPARAGLLLPLAMEACRHGEDFSAGMDPLLRRMLGYEDPTALKRITTIGEQGEFRWLFVPAIHCTGTEFVGHPAVTLVIVHTYDIDDFAWTATYYKTSLSGELVATIYGIYDEGRPQFMNIGVDDDTVQGEWEGEKTFWLRRVP